MLVVVALGAVVLARVIAVGAYLRLSGALACYRILSTGSEVDLVAVLAGREGQMTPPRSDIGRVWAQLPRAGSDVGQDLPHVAVVHYDAFGDPGGRPCCSVAIIDASADGLVISSIHARGESRTHATGALEGDCEVTLRPELQQALAAARTGKGVS